MLTYGTSSSSWIGSLRESAVMDSMAVVKVDRRSRFIDFWRTIIAEGERKLDKLNITEGHNLLPDRWSGRSGWNLLKRECKGDMIIESERFLFSVYLQNWWSLEGHTHNFSPLTQSVKKIRHLPIVNSSRLNQLIPSWTNRFIDTKHVLSTLNMYMYFF